MPEKKEQTLQRIWRCRNEESMKILVTGANGQLGRAINVLARDSGHELINTDAPGVKPTGIIKKLVSLDITQFYKVHIAMIQYKPDMVINCAAYTNVNGCESNKELAYKVNSIGAENLAKGAELVGAKMVQVSTDYVFDGTADKPYVEDDPVNPQSVYGVTKQKGEKLSRNHLSELYIVRTAWLYGDGNNFVKTMLSLAKQGKPLRVVNDQFGTPTSAMELARMIFQLITKEEYGIYHATCEGSTSWYEFAKKIFELAKIDADLSPVTSAEYVTPAKRPAYSVLENRHFNEVFGTRMMQWEDALVEYMESDVIREYLASL